MAFLWKQRAFRWLGNYEVIPERGKAPNLKVGFGLQGIATGNPGYFATTEKTLTTDDGTMNVFTGIGWRANEDHPHALFGFKLSPARARFTVGAQFDGHAWHPFATVPVRDGITIGAYAIEGKKLGLMASWAF